MLDEVDLALIDAVQANPRAPWSELGPVLGAAPMTLSRRWRRLTEAGHAWVTIAPGPRQWFYLESALVGIGCEAASAGGVAAALARLPQVVTVDHVTGADDLFVIVVAPDLPSLSRFLLDVLPRHDGIVRVRASVGTELFGGVTWRLGVLDRAQDERVRARRSGAEEAASRRLGPDDRALYRALGLDGRRGYTDLARELGGTPQAVKRRLNRLLRSGDVMFRCDLARPLAGWHALAGLWLAVPDDRLAEAGRALGGWPETRLCASVLGTANLYVAFGLNSMQHAQRLLGRIVREMPHVSVVERQLALQQVKVFGQILGPDGRRVGSVPVDPWAEG